MTVADVRDWLQCEVLAGKERLDLEVKGAAAADGMSAVLAARCRRGLLITGLANIQSVRTAHVADLAAILYVRGVRPGEKTIELAEQNRIVLLATSLGMFECCGVLHARGLRGLI